MPEPTEEELLRVARLKFVDGLKNNQIAAILRPGKVFTAKSNLTWVQVLVGKAGVWLLGEQEKLARERKKATKERALEAALCKRFSLLAARVVPGGGSDTPYDKILQSKRLGEAAASYFHEISAIAEVNGKELHVAISGNQTMLNMALSLPDVRRPHVTFYASAMIGHGTDPMATRTSHVGPETNATVAWAKSGRFPGQLVYGTVPPYNLKSKAIHRLKNETQQQAVRRQITEDRSENMRFEQITEILDVMAQKVNVAMVGLGVVSVGDTSLQNERTMTGLLNAAGIDVAALAREGVVGDIGYSLFDAKGNGSPRWRFFITAGDSEKESGGVDFYRRLVQNGYPVIVCEGHMKGKAIRIALKAKLFNMLVTDVFTAERLLETKNTTFSP